MAAPEDVTAWRHILTSQPDVTPDSMLRTQHLQSQDAAPSRSDLARQLQSSPSSQTHPPKFINPMYSCPSLSLAVPLDQNTRPHCTCNPVYYIKIILDLGCFRPPARPAHLYKSRFSVLACNTWQTLCKVRWTCVFEKSTQKCIDDLIFQKKMWNLPPG